MNRDDRDRNASLGRPWLGGGGAPNLPSGRSAIPFLPLNKLRGLGTAERRALKRWRITTTAQLFAAAETQADLARLAHDTGIAASRLEALVHRADMARINGIGAVFGEMLLAVGIASMRDLAAAEPQALHARLAALNQAERMARRSPTPEEVEQWVGQARDIRPVTRWT